VLAQLQLESCNQKGCSGAEMGATALKAIRKSIRRPKRDRLDREDTEGVGIVSFACMQGSIYRTSTVHPPKAHRICWLRPTTMLESLLPPLLCFMVTLFSCWNTTFTSLLPSGLLTTMNVVLSSHHPSSTASSYFPCLGLGMTSARCPQGRDIHPAVHFHGS
jgi:hypothetical protein